MKRCAKCQETKSRAEFYERGAGRQYASSYCRICEAKRQKDDIVGRILARTKCRARRRGTVFTLQRSDIVVPAKCPVLGITLNDGTLDGAPSLDRINNSIGYVPGNVAVISWRANRIKSDATPEELRRIASYSTGRASTSSEERTPPSEE